MRVFKAIKNRPLGRLISLGLVHPLARRFRLLLAFDARLFISLFLAEVADNAVSGTLTLKTSECAVQRFVFTDSYSRHIFASFSLWDRYLDLL